MLQFSAMVLSQITVIVGDLVIVSAGRIDGNFRFLRHDLLDPSIVESRE
jgi:hypothetical protein